MIKFNKNGFMIKTTLNFKVKHDDKDEIGYPDFKKNKKIKKRGKK